ncbi:hypothetical protein LTR49_027545 [Elasticomyces elasticus]|nr:hypothetical protein LTR49_027545 [Elasticomyces elasticus]
MVPEHARSSQQAILVQQVDESLGAFWPVDEGQRWVQEHDASDTRKHLDNVPIELSANYAGGPAYGSIQIAQIILAHGMVKAPIGSTEKQEKKRTSEVDKAHKTKKAKNSSKAGKAERVERTDKATKAKEVKKANTVQKADILKTTKTEKGREKIKKQERMENKKKKKRRNKKTRKAEMGTTALLQSMCIA